jgi:hypothetical protein|tara:strand:- start:424 stop:609 length:186 start_codon:yes stop_codon:yes gene_type:complete
LHFQKTVKDFNRQTVQSLNSRVSRFFPGCWIIDEHGWVNPEMSMAVAILLLRIMTERHDRR